MRVGWIGLGDMGYPMAGHVAREWETVVWNRTTTVAERHASEYGSRAVGLREVCNVDVVVTCLPSSSEVEELAGRIEVDLPAGVTWVDCTSGDPAATQRLAARFGARVGLVDAPVSGMVDGAQAGTLTVMAGGPEEMFERVRPVLDTFATTVIHVGPTGTGHLVKALNNAAFAAHLWVAREIVGALERAGADVDSALAAINASSGRSLVTERFLRTSVYTDAPVPGFRVGMLTKDVRIGAATAGSRLLRETADLFGAVVEAVDWDADARETWAVLGEMTGGGDAS